MTSAQVALHEARIAHGRATADHFADAEPVDRESKLHEQIESELKRRGWLYHHDRMDRATGCMIGWPDFTVFPPNRKPFFVECKRKGGKQSPEQKGFEHWASRDGYFYALVFSFDEFLSVLKDLCL